MSPNLRDSDILLRTVSVNAVSHAVQIDIELDLTDGEM